MDCDIHAHLEVKLTGKWYYYAPVDIPRNYHLFARMAGVRSYNQKIMPIALPRGLPDHTTLMTQLHNNDWGVDGHSHSWLNRQELQQIAREFNVRKFGDFWGIYLFGNGVLEFQENPGGYPEQLEDVRLIFWFDN